MERVSAKPPVEIERVSHIRLWETMAKSVVVAPNWTINVEGENGLLPTRERVTAIVSVSKALGLTPAKPSTLTYFATAFLGEATTKTIVFVSLLLSFDLASTCQFKLTSTSGIGMNSSEA